MQRLGPEWDLTISLKALQRARSTLEDFTFSYLPYLNLVPERDFFKYLDVLVWLEATVYQLDEQNELMSKAGTVAPSHRLAGKSCIRDVLKQLSLYDDRIEYELKQADVYWTMERSLTSQILAAGAASSDGGEASFTLADVMQAHEAKSFDYRLLFLVLHKLVDAPYNEALLEFLRVDERLVDIGDDLTDYEDDVEANSFNIFRAFIFLYGRDAQMKLVDLISELEDGHARLLAQLPKEMQAHYWKRHEAASSEPGSGRWVFPAPIFDEAAYRAMLTEQESSHMDRGKSLQGVPKSPFL